MQSISTTSEPVKQTTEQQVSNTESKALPNVIVSSGPKTPPVALKLSTTKHLTPRVWASDTAPVAPAGYDGGDSSDSEWRRRPQRSHSATVPAFAATAAVFPFPIGQVDEPVAAAADATKPTRSYSSKKWSAANELPELFCDSPRPSIAVISQNPRQSTWSRQNSLRLDSPVVALGTPSSNADASAIRAFNTRINLLAQQGMHREVLALIEEAREREDKSLDEALNTQTFTILVKAYCNTGNLEAAEEMVKEMHTFEEHQRPNRFTLNTLLNGFVRRNMMQKASELFREMVASDVVKQRPDHVTYSTIIKGFAAAGDMQSADDLFRTLVDHADPSCRPNIVMCNTVLKGWCFKGEMGCADTLLEEMRTNDNMCSPDVISMNTIIDGHAKNGNVKRAEQLFQIMGDSLLRPNQVTVNSMIDCYTKSGNMAKAEELFFTLEDSADPELCPSPVTYGAMINGYVKTGDLRKAELLFSQIKNHRDPACRPNQVSYTTMIGAAAKAGLLDKAEKLFETMHASQEANCRPNNFTYSILIDGHAKNGNMTRAEELFAQMQATNDRSCKPNRVTFNTMLNGYGRAGQVAKAEQLFQVMQRHSDPNCRPNAITFRTMMHMNRARGHSAQANKYEMHIVADKRGGARR